jgi:predicted nucleotidyltransferase
MQSAHPITSVIPTLEGPVLEALAGTTMPLTLSEVHRLVGPGAASLSGVRRALLRLAVGGVVLTVPGGYQLNREHLACPGIIALTGLRFALYERIAEVVRSWSPPVRTAGVFGSFARGDGSADSDIDIVVLGDDVDVDRLDELATRVEHWTGNSCHVVAVTNEDLERLRANDDPILQSWDDDLVVVHGDRRALTGGGR